MFSKHCCLPSDYGIENIFKTTELILSQLWEGGSDKAIFNLDIILSHYGLQDVKLFEGFRASGQLEKLMETRRIHFRHSWDL